MAEQSFDKPGTGLSLPPPTQTSSPERDPSLRSGPPAPGFAFSQASLQDYADCPRRFQLRYVLQVRWPAAHDRSAIEHVRKGAEFHHLVHQHTLGLPAATLTAIVRARTLDRQATAGDALHQQHSVDIAAAEGLDRWWNAYLNVPPPDLPAALRQAEVYLSTPLAACFDPQGYRISARYDLLAIEPGRRAVIVDWKTEQKRPMRAWLEKRWQTLIYRYVLVRAGTQLNGGTPIVPEQVEMIYWFANFPEQIERFPYDAGQHLAAERALAAEIAAIGERVRVAQGPESWPLTDQVSRCQYCTYRTLCDREPDALIRKVAAEEGLPELQAHGFAEFTGSEGDPGEPIRGEHVHLDFDLDLDQIAEIEF